MKLKTLFVLLSCFASGLSLLSQEDSLKTKIHFGLKIGITQSNINAQYEIAEATETGSITHDLSNSKSGLGTIFGLTLSYQFDSFFSIGTGLDFVTYKTSHDYNTIEMMPGFGVARETVAGILDQKRVSLQVPLTAKVSFGKNIRLGIYAGVYLNGKGVGNGSWNYTENIYAEIIENNLIINSPPRVLLSSEQYGFTGKTNFGWILGGDLSFSVIKKLDFSLSAYYTRDINSENSLIPYLRNSVNVSLGVIFR